MKSPRLRSLLVFLLLGLLLLSSCMKETKKEDLTITSFDECVAAGYPVAESYPEQCRTPEGRVFARDIEGESLYADIIRVSSPHRDEQVISPLRVSGEARGQWFFEASFPVVLLSDDGTELATSFAEATDEWMTEEYVPFSATLEFVVPEGATSGKLILEKSNPSGLPENEEQLGIPVRF